MKQPTLKQYKTLLFTILENLDTLIEKHQVSKSSLSKDDWRLEKHSLNVLTECHYQMKQLYNNQ